MPSWSLPAFIAPQLLTWNALLLFGGLLVFGLLAGHFVSKSPWIPRLTGYLLIGFALGAGGLNWLSGDVLDLVNIFADVAVALVVYQLGRYVDLEWLKRERWLLLTVAGASLLGFLLVWQALEATGIARQLAMLAAVFAIGTSPAVVMVVVRDLKAEGHITRRLAVMTALNNIVALLAAYVLLPLVATETRTPLVTLVSHTVYVLLGSLVLGYLTHRLMIPLARLLGRDRNRQFLLIIAAIALIVGATHALQLPVLLTMLAFSILSKNFDLEYDVMDLEFDVAGELMIVMLFVAIGASVQVTDIKAIGLAVVALVLARTAAIGITVFAFARPARLNLRQAGFLTLGSLPITEAGLGLIQLAYLYPHISKDIAPLLAGTLILTELIGPIATQFALLKSGEGHNGQSHDQLRS